MTTTLPRRPSVVSFGPTLVTFLGIDAHGFLRVCSVDRNIVGSRRSRVLTQGDFTTKVTSVFGAGILTELLHLCFTLELQLP